MIARKVSVETRARIRSGCAEDYERTGRQSAATLRDLCDDAIMLDERLTITVLAGATVLMQLLPNLTLPEATLAFSLAVEGAIADQQRRHGHEQN